MNAVLRAVSGMALAAMLLAQGVVQAQVPAGERQALINLYHATGGDDWDTNDGWLGLAGTECDWHGVSCFTFQSDMPSVSRIDLSGNNLTGELPVTLSDLVHLGSLRLQNNNLVGPIPAGLGQLNRLFILSLRANQFSGPIPGELLAAGSGMSTTFDLSLNQLSGYTPPPVETPGDTISLNLRNNRLETLPPQSWIQSQRIRRLHLSGNRIEGELDLEFQSWPELTWLDLSDNGITGLIGLDAQTLERLRRLELSDNRIDGWPLEEDLLPALRVLDLCDNQLDGTIPEHLRNRGGLDELHLCNNRIVGGLEHLFAMPDLLRLDLSGNPLDSLPEEMGGPAFFVTLKINNANLAGSLPDGLSELTVVHLELSDNQFTGSIAPALAAMRTTGVVRLDLSRNDFSGSIPEAILDLNFRFPDGIDLCWNRFDLPIDEAILSHLESVHPGGDPTDCIDRERRLMNPAVSGSWYTPKRNGEGYSLMLLEDGSLLTYFFTFPSPLMDQGPLMWVLNQGPASGPAVRYPVMQQPRNGRFDEGLGANGFLLDLDAAVSIDALADGLLHIFTRWDLQTEISIIVDPPPPPFAHRSDFARLTQLAGSTCDITQPHQWISGLWYDPERDGEGFVVEVNFDGRGVVYWFTYTPDGSGQTWMIGDGAFDNNTLHIDNLSQPTGTFFGSSYRPDRVEIIHWGNLAIEFFDDATGHVFWDSVFEDFGNGDYPIEQLARPLLAECESQQI